MSPWAWLKKTLAFFKADPNAFAHPSIPSVDMRDRAYWALFPPTPPPEVVVDWDQAPEGFYIWRYHQQKKMAVWLTGRYEDTEMGREWEAMPAPDFGATEHCKLALDAPQIAELKARRKAAHLASKWSDASNPELETRKPRL